MLLIAAWLGCSTSDELTPRAENPRERMVSRKKTEFPDYGLKYFPGIGWLYISPGTSPEILFKTPAEKLEIAGRAFEAKEYKRAMFAARSVYSGATGRPYSTAAPEARYLVGRIYESRTLDQYAFKEYQVLQERYPNYPRRDEVLQRQFEIAGRFLEGRRFKWKLPYQESVYIPTFPSMIKTAKMYNQMVTNAPFSPLGAEAQLNIGQAYEKRVGGWFGTLFAGDTEYSEAVKAYETTARRYGPRADTDGEPEEVFALIDGANGDGKLTRDDFPNEFWNRLTPADQDKNGAVSLKELAAVDAFKLLDLNNDGLWRLGADQDQFSQEAWTDIEDKRLDRNADGAVSASEFLLFSVTRTQEDSLWETLDITGADGTGNRDDQLTRHDFPNDLWERVAELDIDNDGAVQRDEVLVKGAAKVFEALDLSGDGVVSETDYPGMNWRRLTGLDTDNDQQVTADELEKTWQRVDLVGLLDGNKDGQLTEVDVPNEMVLMWRRLATLFEVEPADGFIRRQDMILKDPMALLDVNGNGKVERTELHKRHWRVVALADGNGDGILTSGELGARRMADLFDSTRDDQFTNADFPNGNWLRLAHADTNRDGEVTLEELKTARQRLHDLAAIARYRVARIFERQASDGLYDQSFAEKAIDAYTDLRTLHGDDPAQQDRLADAENRIEAMRLEQARGALAIARFYEFNNKWVGAQKYHQRVVALTSELASGQKMNADALKRVDELFVKRMERAVNLFAEGSDYEKDDPALALRRFQEAQDNFQDMILEDHLEEDDKRLQRAKMVLAALPGKVLEMEARLDKATRD